MKNKTTIALILIIVGLVIGSSVYAMKAEDALAEALQPSKIEVQKEQLVNSEKIWAQKEEVKQNCIFTIQEIDKEKEILEQEIRELRNEILGLN